jgi:hypothetical protein
LYLKRADIKPAIHDPIETGTALVEERRRSKTGVASINGRAARQQRMRESRTAIVLQWTKHWIGVDLVARAR